MYKNFATPAEHDAAMRLAQDPPFSFRYGGKPFPQGFTKTGPYEYTHTETGLKVTLAVSTYGEDSSAVEWVPYFENCGEKDSLLLEDICSLDATIPCKSDAWIGYLRGPHSKIDDFAYVEEPLTDNTFGGVGSRDYVPFFNLGTEKNAGFVLALGWTGIWEMHAVKESEDALHVTLRMKTSHFLLHPGEKVRQPRIMMLFWEGDRLRGQNMCRRHLVLHHIPVGEDGEPYPPVCSNAWGGMKAENHIKYCQYMKEHDLKFDCYWIDAGWHGPDHPTEEFQNFYVEDWAYNIGDWNINRCQYPNGMREVSDAAADAGMKLLLWFCPYTCNEGIGWYKEHPEWGSPLSDPHPIGRNPKLTRVSAINISIPEAKQWLMDTIGKVMTENNVKGYREDTGIPYAGEDALDRVGIGEITAVTGLYDIWDSFLAKIPDLVIDNCGGGASRVDLETVSRAYVLWRSDYNCSPKGDPIGSQFGNWGLGHFLPLINGASPPKAGNTYSFRSSLYGGMNFGMYHPCGYGSAPTGPAPDYPVEWHRRMLEQWQLTKPLLSGDFYPLTDCDTATTSVCAYAFDRPDLERGCLFAFFRQDTAEDAVTLHLHLPEGKYLFTDYDTDAQKEVLIGKDGADFTVTAPEKPYAASWYFQRI